MLRIINALSPIKVSGGKEEWREWLLSTGFNGTSMLRKDSSGSYEFSPQEREIIMGYVGEQDLWKEVEAISKDKSYNVFLDDLRAQRSSGTENRQNALPEQTGPVYDALRKVLKRGLERAEQKALANGDIPVDTILGAKLARKYLKFGNIQEAINVQQSTTNQQ